MDDNLLKNAVSVVESIFNLLDVKNIGTRQTDKINSLVMYNSKGKELFKIMVDDYTKHVNKTRVED